MINTEQKASKGMMKFVLTIFVIAIIVAVAYLVLFTPGQPVP
jgi:heme/copper-type cytochrome/quinol oxidase subunit 4